MALEVWIPALFLRFPGKESANQHENGQKGRDEGEGNAVLKVAGDIVGDHGKKHRAQQSGAGDAQSGETGFVFYHAPQALHRGEDAKNEASSGEKAAKHIKKAGEKIVARDPSEKSGALHMYIGTRQCHGKGNKSGKQEGGCPKKLGGVCGA